MVKSIGHCNTIVNANWLKEELAEVEVLVLVDLHSAVVVGKMHHSVDVAYMVVDDNRDRYCDNNIVAAGYCFVAGSSYRFGSYFLVCFH